MARTHRSKKQGGVGGRILVYFQSPWLPVTLKKGGLLVLNTWVLFDLRSYADGEAPPVNARRAALNSVLHWPLTLIQTVTVSALAYERDSLRVGETECLI